MSHHSGDADDDIGDEAGSSARVRNRAPIRHELSAAALERARQGDTGAFEELYRAHAPRIFALCLRLAANRVEAEEYTQDVFVRVWQSLPGYRGESALVSWIHRIAVNTVLERQRSTRRRVSRVSIEEDTVIAAQPSRADMPDERIDLSAALERLSDIQRTVFVLREIEGYSFAEISDVTSTVESTVRSHLYRARTVLAAVLR